MITISLCMIVKNEEDTLARCLESVQDIVDEIIIVDTGSTDKTKEIAARFTSAIYDFQWLDDFSAARNYSFAQATMDYILWLDADDIILEPDRQKLKKLKETLDSSVDFVMFKYNTGFDSQGKVTFSYSRERLSKRTANLRWLEPVHEYLPMSGKIINSDICITHHKIHPSAGGRNLKIYEKTVAEGKELSPRGLYYFARELKDNARYEEASAYFTRFLDSGKGWVEDNINACAELAGCYKATGRTDDYLKTLLRSFEYAAPRAEICCQVGYHFKDRAKYEEAVFWFDLATKLQKPINSWGFRREDYWGYIPCMELCVCHYRLGNLKAAIKYNNKAGTYKPNDPAVTYNRKFFGQLKNKELVTR